MAAAPLSLPPAGFWKRLWAAILDLICWYLLFLALLAAAYALLATSVSGESFGTLMAVAALGGFWLYSALLEASPLRATLGKRAARIVVTDAAGCRLGLARASLRCLGKLAILATGGLGLLTCLVDRQHRGLDDFIAGTRLKDVEATTGKGPRPWWRLAIGPVVLAIVFAVLGEAAFDAFATRTKREQIIDLMLALREGPQAAYADFLLDRGRPPRRDELPAFAHPRVHSLDVSADGVLTVRVAPPDEAVLRFVPVRNGDGTVGWNCRVEAREPRFFPRHCRP